MNLCAVPTSGVVKTLSAPPRVERQGLDALRLQVDRGDVASEIEAAAVGCDVEGLPR